MNKICSVCGFSGENVWRDGKYFCASCGSEIDMTAPDSAPKSDSVVVNAECPICKNREGNVVRGGKCYCALCASEIDLAAQNQRSSYGNSYSESYGRPFSYDAKSARKKELEKKRNGHLVWAIVWVFLCWPVSIYFFYKLYQDSQELSKI